MNNLGLNWGNNKTKKINKWINKKNKLNEWNVKIKLK